VVAGAAGYRGKIGKITPEIIYANVCVINVCTTLEISLSISLFLLSSLNREEIWST